MHDSNVLRVTGKSKVQALLLRVQELLGLEHEALHFLRRRTHERAVVELLVHVVLQHVVLVLVRLREVRELLLFQRLRGLLLRGNGRNDRRLLRRTFRENTRNDRHRVGQMDSTCLVWPAGT